jgi:membrane protein implicated in regulation of membrane protease activity
MQRFYTGLAVVFWMIFIAVLLAFVVGWMQISVRFWVGIICSFALAVVFTIILARCRSKAKDSTV